MTRIETFPFSWRYSRGRLQNDESVHYGWGPAWAKCSSCPQTVDLLVKQELDGRFGIVAATPGQKS
jgi:hypothetical protein